MRKAALFLLLVFTLFFVESSIAQFVVDLRTGVKNNTNQLLPINSSAPIYNSFDDTWVINTPYDPPGVYNPIGVGVTVNWINPYNPVCRIISPYLDFSGQPIAHPTAWTGYVSYYLKTTFDLASCQVQSGVISIKGETGYSGIKSISINGTSVFTSFGWGQVGAWNIPINAPGIFQQGINTIVLETMQAPNGQLCIQMEAFLTLQTCAFIDLKVMDKESIEKSEFCIDEDVFFNVNGLKFTNNTIALEQNYGNGYTTMAIVQNYIGYTNTINVKDFFSNQLSAALQPNIPYRLKVTLNGGCGTVVRTKDFIFKCCNDSPDASFNLIPNNSSQITFNNSTSGAHLWEVYPISSANGNILSSNPVASSQANKFVFAKDEQCYYVKHTVSNLCGENCSSKRFCEFNCQDRECNIAKPENLHFDKVTNQLSWSGVTGAGSYIIEITVNDPNCCDGSVGPILVPAPVSIHVNTNSYILDYQTDLGLQERMNCFSWKVYALCPGGVRSQSSDLVCEMFPGAKGTENGLNASENQLINDSGGFGEIGRDKTTSVSLFPNPANSSVSLEINSTQGMELNITVFNSTGQIVEAIRDIKIQEKLSSIKLNTEHLNKGVYLIKILTSGNKLITKKLIIE